MPNLTFSLNVEHGFAKAAQEVADLGPRSKEGVRTATEDSTNILSNALSRFMPRSPGPGPHLADTAILSEVLETPEGFVGRAYTEEEVPYYLEVGTRPHEIRPRLKKALAFGPWQGRDWVLAKVNHPGTRAYLYYEEAGYSAEAAIEQTYDDEMRRIFGGP